MAWRRFLLLPRFPCLSLKSPASHVSVALWGQRSCSLEMKITLRGWDFGIRCFGPKGRCAVQRRVDELWRGLPGACLLPLSLNPLASPHSFQLTVEMFDYMDCELKLSESGELGGSRCGNLETRNQGCLCEPD